MSERIEEIRFAGSGRDSLSGRLGIFRSPSRVVYVLFAYCFTCSKRFRLRLG